MWGWVPMWAVAGLERISCLVSTPGSTAVLRLMVTGSESKGSGIRVTFACGETQRSRGEGANRKDLRGHAGWS